MSLKIVIKHYFNCQNGSCRTKRPLADYPGGWALPRHSFVSAEPRHDRRTESVLFFYCPLLGHAVYTEVVVGPFWVVNFIYIMFLKWRGNFYFKGTRGLDVWKLSNIYAFVVSRRYFFSKPLSKNLTSPKKKLIELPQTKFVVNSW